MAASANILKRLPLVVFLLCAVVYANAQSQQKQIDSCRLLLKSMPDDTNRINVMLYLGQELWFNRSIPEAIDMLKQTIRQSEQKNFFKHVANARLMIANAYINIEQYDSTFEYLQSAMYWAQRLKQDEHIPKIEQIYAYLYNMLGDQKKALSYALAAAADFEKSTIPEVNVQSVYAWLEVGRIFEKQQQNDKALYYYNKALDKAQKAYDNKEWYVGPAMLGIANAYVKLNRLAEARAMYMLIIDKGPNVTSIENIISCFNGLGNIAIREKDYPASIEYYQRTVAFATVWNLRTTVDDGLCGAGYAFLLNGQYDSADVYLHKGLTSAMLSRDNNMISQAYKNLSLLNEKRNNYKEALKYAQLYKSVSDSIYNHNKITSLNNLEILYQTNQKEKQIIMLEANNAEKQVQLIKRSRLLFITGITIVALLIIILLFYYNSRNKQVIAKQQQLLQEKKIQELEQQQKMVALQSMVAGQEAERARIARDLHDGLGGLFATVKMHMSALKHEHAELQDDTLFNKSYAMVDNAAGELRRVAHNMMPEVLVKLGVIQALQDFIANINAKNNVNISLQVYGMEERLPSEMEINIFRVVQELITNIVKHAKATEAIVQFNNDGSKLHLVVEDNGVGFDMAAVDVQVHAGIESIKNRVTYLNGSVVIDSVPDEGTTVTMEFLMPGAATA